MTRFLVALVMAFLVFGAGCAKQDKPVAPVQVSPPPLPRPQAETGPLRINEAALAMIKEEEGLRLKAYQNSGQWLIGYGHARTARPGQRITAARAEELLREDIQACEDAVGENVSVPLSANEFSALTALCFNIGTLNFAQSTVVQKLNAGDRVGAADAFLMWTKAGGKTLDLLEKRRARERALFLS